MSNLKDEELFSLFDLTQNSKESRQGDRSSVVRFYDQAEKDAFVQKTYSGNLSQLQRRENELLLHVRLATVQVNGKTTYLHTRIAPMHLAKGHTVEGIFEITQRWQGLDLLDWNRLALHHHQSGKEFAPLMQNIGFLLALARSTLKALHLMHLAGLVHCDIKADNLCLPWIKNSLQHNPQGAWLGSINPDQLKIIDLGLTLKKKNERGDIPDLAGAKPHTSNHAPRLVAAYEEHLQKTGQTRIFEQLDWRIDMWAVGKMLQDWGENPQLLGTKRLSYGFFQLLQDLKSIEEDFKPDPNASQPSLTPADLPHPVLISRIDELIGYYDHAWPFMVAPARVVVSPAQAQPSTVRPPPAPAKPPPPLPVLRRSGPKPAAAPAPILLIAKRYKPHGDGSEVLDTQTGLTWQRFSVGQRWDAKRGKPVGEAKRFNLTEAKKLSSGGWRLPTLRELFSLVYGSKGLGQYKVGLNDGGPELKAGCLGEDYQRPTINLEAFPGTAEFKYWTSSEVVTGKSSTAWDVGFCGGVVGCYQPDEDGYVRLVR